MKRKFLVFILIFVFVEFSASGLLNINLKPVLKSATGLVNDLAQFTLNEILNFKSFKSLFNKVYATLELENIALLNFLINQRDVDKHNKKYKEGLVSYNRAVCEYSDMSNEDMNKYVNKFHIPNIKRNRRKKKVRNVRVVPETVEEEPVEEEEEVAGPKTKPARSATKKNGKAKPILKSDKTISKRKKATLTEEDFGPEEKEPISRQSVNTKDYTDADYEPIEEEEAESNQENPEYIDEYHVADLPVHPDDVYEQELLEEEIHPEHDLLSIHSKDDHLNYITDGFDTPVLNQGVCGSCWSFSAAAAIEAAWFIKTGDLVKLSEQQLIDCNRDNDNNGCEGGNMANAFEFLEDNGGISLSSRYPYKGNDTYKCKNVSPDIEVTSHELLDPGDEDLLLEKLFQHGPIAVAIDASLKTFQTYKSGVYYDPKCSDRVNHAVLLVGYGTVKETNEDYWIIKNTYGKTWGIHGYMKLARNRDNHCGITEFAAYPICS